MILYSKFSNDRRPDLSIRTDIVRYADGKRAVRKTAASPAANAHIAGIAGSGRALADAFAGTPFEANRGTLTAEGCLELEYLEGHTLEEEADACLEDREAFYALMDDYIAAVKSLAGTVFARTEAFSAVFGEAALPEGVPAMAPANIDMVLGNIITGRCWQVIDYEWTFDFPVPADYVVWRVLHYYTGTREDRLRLREEGLYARYGISDETTAVCERMETAFQAYVDGDRRALRHLYPLISPGCVRLGDGFRTYRDGDRTRTVTLLQADGSIYDRLPSVRSDMTGHWRFEVPADGLDSLTLQFEEVPLNLHIHTLEADGIRLGGDNLSSDAVIIYAQEVLMTSGSHRLTIGGWPAGTRVLTVDILCELLDPSMNALWQRLGDTVRQEQIVDAGEKAMLRRRIADDGARLNHLENMITNRFSAAVELGQVKVVKTYRKLRVRCGQSDPMASLRPHIDPQEAGYLFNIDAGLHHNRYVSVVGWAFCSEYRRNNIRLCDADGTPVPANIQRKPRPDVAAGLGIDPNAMIAFEINVLYENITKLPLVVEIEDARGYFAVSLADRINPDFVDKGRRGQFDASRDGRTTHNYDDLFALERVTAAELKRQRGESFPYEPKISVCIPIYRTPLPYLKDIIDAILEQSYSRIQLCLADGSPDTVNETFIRDNYGRDPRLVYRHLTENGGISDNTNAAFALADGDFVMLADHDDLVEKNAVYEIVKAINSRGDVDIVYTDEDKVTMDGTIFFDPAFKPDFSWEYLRSGNYICHIFCVRRSLLEAVGGERRRYDGAQDFDFILRCCESARYVAHVPKVLYHWRSHPLSTSGNPESKGYAYDNGAAALNDHYQRLGIPARAGRDGHYLGYYRTWFSVKPDTLISIIIPNRDQTEVLRRAVESVFEKSAYRNFEILIVENGSTDPSVFAYYRELQAGHDNVRVLYWDKGFNYAAINNFAAGKALGSMLLFLNNDVEVLTPSWLEEMLGCCQLDGVGACGAKLLYPDGRIQHIGVVVGLGGAAGHMGLGMPADSEAPGRRTQVTQNVSAVTGACLMVSAAVFREVGGFDEDLSVSYNDVDLCLRIGRTGRRIVMNPHAELIHFESLSRGSDRAAVSPEKHERQMREAGIFRERWADLLQNGDPFYNPHYALDASEFRMKGEFLAQENPENF